MNFSSNSESALRKMVLLLLLMVVPVFAWGQKKTPSAPAPKPPAAPRPSAPKPAAKPATPAQHNTPTSKPGTTASKPGATAAGKPGSTTAGKPSTTTGKPGTTTAGKPGATGKSGTAAAGKPGPGEKGGPAPAKGSHVPPGHDVALKGGGSAHIRPNGQIRSVNKNGMHIEHNLHGSRKVVSEKNGVRTVSTGKHGGYTQRAYVTRGGHSYYQRTYYHNGVYRTGVYRGYSYGGYNYYGYNPGYYYGAGYYGWAGNPWASPVAWGWGWGGMPWYGYYGFNPYASYAGPAFWLTDYLIAANLQAAYAAALGGQAVSGGVNVMASEPWNDTGTEIVQGQTYTIAASGIASFQNGNPNANVSPAGDGRPVCSANPEPTLPGVPCMSLVGKIGQDGVPFYVGPAKKFVAPASGELFLGMNDNYFGDNVGNWVVAIHQKGGGDSGGDQTEDASAPAAAAPAGSNPVALSDDVKQAIAEEVKAQIAAEKADAAQAGASAGGAQAQPSKDEVPPALDPARRTFVVDTDLAVVADGQECSLTAGDVLTRLTDTPDAEQKVNVSVQSSKKSDCGSGKLVAVSVDDLQEMRNHFQEKLDMGLKTMAEKQGTGGMPKAPDTKTTASTVPPPPADKTAGKALEDQQAAADQTETEVKQEAAGSAAGGVQ